MLINRKMPLRVEITLLLIMKLIGLGILWWLCCAHFPRPLNVNQQLLSLSKQNERG